MPNSSCLRLPTQTASESKHFHACDRPRTRAVIGAQGCNWYRHPYPHARASCTLETSLTSTSLVHCHRIAKSVELGSVVLMTICHGGAPVSTETRGPIVSASRLIERSGGRDDGPTGKNREKFYRVCVAAGNLPRLRRIVAERCTTSGGQGTFQPGFDIGVK